jgi:cytochrome c556
VLLLACGASAALADPITDRENLMKGVQAATKDANGLAKGTTPWDAAKAKATAQVYIDAAAKLPTLFPKGSETGNKTAADPKIWSDTAGFKLAAAKFGTDGKALAAAPDQAAYATAFADVLKDCTACHGTYRVKPQQ